MGPATKKRAHIYHIVDEKNLFPLTSSCADAARLLLISTYIALYVTFTILVSFLQDHHCLPHRLKSTLFQIFSNGAAPKGPAE